MATSLNMTSTLKTGSGQILGLNVLVAVKVKSWKSSMLTAMNCENYRC